MGTDKAFVEVDGRPMVRHVADALEAAGCERVIAVGGSQPGLTALGLTVVEDRWPGEGPLGGIITALGASDELGAPLVLVVGCDLPSVTSTTLVGLVAALRAADPAVTADVVADVVADVAVARTDRDEPLCAAWAAVPALAELGPSFDAGERAVHRAMARLRVARVPVGRAELHNVNRPDDLIGL